MGTLTDGGYATLADIATRKDPHGYALPMANVLSKKVSILKKMMFLPANKSDGHLIAQADGTLASASWRQYNQGTAPDKSNTVQYTESLGYLEAFSFIDEKLLDNNGGPEWRMSEDVLRMEGLAQLFGTSVFYESVTTNPERIHGLAPRYPATTGYDSSDYVLTTADAGGSANSGTNCRSLWLLNVAPGKIYGIYDPMKGPAGMDFKDNGRQRSEDSSGRILYGYETQVGWSLGIVVQDYRYAVRIQYDPDDSVMASSQRGLLDLAVEAMSRIYESEGACWMMDRDTQILINKQLQSNENRTMTYVAGGGRVLSDPTQGPGFREFYGLPAYIEDSLVAETAIS